MPTLRELASRLRIPLADAALGALAHRAQPAPEHRRALTWAHRLPGTLTRTAIERTTALALALREREPDPHLRRTLRETEPITRTSWIHLPPLAADQLADQTPRTLPRLLDRLTSWDRWLEHPTLDPRRTRSVTLPGALPTTVAYRFRDATHRDRTLPTVDLAIGPRALLYGPRLPAPLRPHTLAEHLHPRLPHYHTGRLDPRTHLRLPPHLAHLLPALLLLAESLTRTHRHPLSEWLIPTQPHPVTLIHSPKRTAITRGPGPLAFALARAVNAQAGQHRHQHLYAAHRTYLQPDPPPQPRFPRTLLHAYTELTDAHLRYEELERRNDHEHGPAATLHQLPDQPLTNQDRRTLHRALHRLHELLTRWHDDAAHAPPIDEYLEAAHDLLRAADTTR